MDSVNALTAIVWTILSVVCVFVIPLIVSARINHGTKHIYDEMLESVKNSHAKIALQEKNSREIRLKSAIIAELFAEWLSPNSDRKKLRQLTFEAFLWLPLPLANELSLILAHEDNAMDSREFIIQVRKLLLGDDDTLESTKITSFRLTPEELSKSFRS